MAAALLLGAEFTESQEEGRTIHPLDTST
jgi:hypothetical protein